MNDLNFHLIKKLDREKQMKPKLSKMNQIIEIKIEINNIENINQIEKIIKIEDDFLVERQQ